MLDTIVCSDALTYLRTVPDESVHCCITSPPYFGLRQYLFNGAVTLDSTLPIETRNEVLEELKRLGIHARL
jgi:DNA modification methylase